MKGRNLDENTMDSDQDVEWYMRGGDGWTPDSVP